MHSVAFGPPIVNDCYLVFANQSFNVTIAHDTSEIRIVYISTTYECVIVHSVCKRNVNTIRTVEMNKRRVEEIEMQKKPKRVAAAATAHNEEKKDEKTKQRKKRITRMRRDEKKHNNGIENAHTEPRHTIVAF